MRDKKNIVITVRERPESDSDDVYFSHIADKSYLGFGFRRKRDGKICVLKCPRCARENYAPVVATGLCHWCRYNPNV